MPDKYQITAEKAQQFTSILLMDYIVNRSGELPVLMGGNFATLEPLVIKLNAAGYVKTPSQDEKGMNYLPTDKGKEALSKFMQRYSEYLKLYDVFCAADLTAGEFAFAKFFDFDTDAAWDAFLNEERWEDVRIAVAEFKGLDPLEIVFMSFLNEDRFDYTTNTWQFDVSSGMIYDQMAEICNTALSVEQINQGDDTVMPDIITQGAEITMKLLKQEEENKKAEAEYEEANRPVETTTVTENTITEDNYAYPPQYYEPYYQPSYVSPLWLGLLFLL
jgi:DNA-binding PadR family transcriptional regulator